MLDFAALVPYCGIREELFFDHRFAPACLTPEDGSESLRQSLGFNLVFPPIVTHSNPRRPQILLLLLLLPLADGIGMRQL